MEMYAVLAIGVVLTGVVGAWWLKGRALSSSLDVGAVSGVWLIEHKCNTSDSSRA